MASSGDQDPTPAASRGQRRFEAMLAAGLLVFGLLLVPALIYLTGSLLLGAYGGGEHIGSFYGDFLRDLGGGSVRAWLLVLGPYLLVQLGRLTLSDFRPGSNSDLSPPAARQGRSGIDRQTRERREPTLKL